MLQPQPVFHALAQGAQSAYAVRLRASGEIAKLAARMKPAIALAVFVVVLGDFANELNAAQPSGPRTGRVRVEGHSLTDDNGQFLGLGVSYFTALWRCKHDRERLESDLAFLARQGFNYYRMLSMVGYHPAWEGREIAPVSFANKDGKRVGAWPDYWEQLRQLIDLAYDRYGLRVQITIFADAQLMPQKEARIEHMRKLLADVGSTRSSCWKWRTKRGKTVSPVMKAWPTCASLQNT
jgi:hypothetical protein